MNPITTGDRIADFVRPRSNGQLIQLYKDYCAQSLSLWVIGAECPDEVASLWLVETTAGRQPDDARPLLITTERSSLRLPGKGLTVVDDGLYIAYLMAGCDPATMASIIEVNANMHVTARRDFIANDEPKLVESNRPLSQAPQSPVDRPAPILVVPDVLDSTWCERLIRLCESDNEPSGVLSQRDGELVYQADHAIKSRLEHRIQSSDLMTELVAVIARRVLPEIRWASCFNVTRYEGMKVVRYDADDQGHFSVHRDNDGQDTAHRRFAMTINLNQPDYQGGELSFPEYSQRPCHLPTGTAVVFSCNLAHQVSEVSTGQRYALVSFFYAEDQDLTPVQYRQG